MQQRVVVWFGLRRATLEKSAEAHLAAQVVWLAVDREQ